MRINHRLANGIQEVDGSIPFGSTSFKINFNNNLTIIFLFPVGDSNRLRCLVAPSLITPGLPS